MRKKIGYFLSPRSRVAKKKNNNNNKKKKTGGTRSKKKQEIRPAGAGAAAGAPDIEPGQREREAIQQTEQDQDLRGQHAGSLPNILRQPRDQLARSVLEHAGNHAPLFRGRQEELSNCRILEAQVVLLCADVVLKTINCEHVEEDWNELCAAAQASLNSLSVTLHPR